MNIFKAPSVPDRMTARILLALWLLAAAVKAGPPTRELTAAIALQLIELRQSCMPWGDRPVASAPKVASICDGTREEGDFRKSHVRRVTTVEGVVEKGYRARRVVTRDFEWSDEYGWHFTETHRERTGDAIWIWSELKGVVVVR